MNQTARPLRVVHVCLSSVFTPGLKYQDNLLSDANAAAGNDVTVIAACEKYEGGHRIQTSAEDLFLDSGVRLIRLPYTQRMPYFVARRLAATNGLRELLESLDPDVVLFHGAVGWGLLALDDFAKLNGRARIFLDVHADSNNTGRNPFVRRFLYGHFYRLLISRLMNRVEKVLFITDECRVFAETVLRVPSEKLEYFPLGGVPVDAVYRRACRVKVRDRLGFSDSDVIVLHSGKFDPGKRTIELIREFSASNAQAFLVLAGVVTKEIESDFQEVYGDSRVRYLGWVGGDDLIDLMCASDVYAQPGSQSASLQAAICAGLPVVAYPHLSHRRIIDGNGFVAASMTEFVSRIELLVASDALRASMANRSDEIARSKLDYQKLAKRICG